MSKKRAYEQVATGTPQERLAQALNVLDVTDSRDQVDSALRTLATPEVMPLLNDAHRQALRSKYLEYAGAPPAKDKGGLLREKLIGLLMEIGHPADLDIYLDGIYTYIPQPVDDVAQNLRAASLLGLARINPPLACMYATKLLGEEDTSKFNCEPSITAINVLARSSEPLPIYQFILLRGQTFAGKRGEALACAFTALDNEFPADLILKAAEPFVAADDAVACTGLVDLLTRRNEAPLNALLDRIARTTKDGDLRRYALLKMVASQQPALTDLLYGLARTCPLAQIADYVEAIELTPHKQREATLSLLQKRTA